DPAGRTSGARRGPGRAGLAPATPGTTHRPEGNAPHRQGCTSPCRGRCGGGRSGGPHERTGTAEPGGVPGACTGDLSAACTDRRQPVRFPGPGRPGPGDGHRNGRGVGHGPGGGGKSSPTHRVHTRHPPVGRAAAAGAADRYPYPQPGRDVERVGHRGELKALSGPVTRGASWVTFGVLFSTVVWPAQGRGCLLSRGFSRLGGTARKDGAGRFIVFDLSEHPSRVV